METIYAHPFMTMGFIFWTAVCIHAITIKVKKD
ncbi:hypothetical protein NRS6110_03714 [Bacillus subtilis]|nr:hypothetical protein BSn5_14740 [Bacillus subtilis BSn5]QHM85349.1 hypothetical protein DXY22_03424 [Bacillus subtilis]TDO84941.1 hypothetical protein BDW29_3869 [Bacillus sp. AtDRG31]CAF1780587.1 hypothetical protein NRS6110_03714 [Bacillus subtilis]SEO07209.1 hypothetical protein SAMN04487778_10644 [Bacillus subtilis]